MIKKIQSRFILFTMLVIGLTLAFVTFIFISGNADPTAHHRSVILVIIILAIVLLASITLSRLAIAPIKKAWQQQLDFTADASHELRTPLAVIQSSLEILMDDPNATVKEQQKWVDNIHNETLRLNKIVDDLLTLSRADTNEVEMLFTDFPINLIVEEQISAFEQMAAGKQVILESSIDDELMIHGDAQRLSQLFRILIDNSLKYMGKSGKITISAFEEKKNIKIIYQDDGVGIPAEDVPNIFKRFYRVDKARSRKEGGSGLGLAIAKWIVEAHNGEILLKSDTNQGVVFTILLNRIKKEH